MKNRDLNKTGLEELKGTILNAISDNRLENKDCSEFHYEIFNTDYFIIGYYDAEKWLNENYGIFAAIEYIKTYEQDNFGEVTTDLSSSEKVVNMLAYILGEEILQESEILRDNWDSALDSDQLSEFKEEIESIKLEW